MARSTDSEQPVAESPSTPPGNSHTQETQTSKKRKASPDSASDRIQETSTDPRTDDSTESAQPPLPDEPTPPPLSDEEPPELKEEDDGWQPVWDDTTQAFYFYNRFTQVTQWENPRVPSETQIHATNHDRIAAAAAPGNTGSTTTTSTTSDTTELHPAVAGGYNPAIHGSYDPNAPYAQYASLDPSVHGPEQVEPATTDAEGYGAEAHFNRFTGRFQPSTLQPSNFNDESKSKRQMNAFFDVDAAANSHDGRSLKAERAGKKLTKSEVKQFRERRRERKEEKRRAWLRD